MEVMEFMYFLSSMSVKENFKKNVFLFTLDLKIHNVSVGGPYREKLDRKRSNLVG